MTFTCYEVAQASGLQPRKKVGQEVLYTCPIHDDQRPSLKINPSKDCWLCGPCDRNGNGWALAAFIARVGPGDKPAVTRWLRDHGLFNGDDSSKRIVTTYDYRDEQGTLLYQTVRYEPKDFRQRRPDGNGGWFWNLQGVRLVPYRLPEWKDKPYVYICEGEKDVDNLRAIGIPATCNPMGAGKWKQEYNTSFIGKRVFILPDNDKPGEEHARDVARNLLGVAQEVRIIRLPNLVPKGDASDWIKAGGTRQHLGRIVHETPVFTRDEFSRLEKVHPEADAPTDSTHRSTAVEASDLGLEKREGQSWPDTASPLPALLPETPSLPPEMLPDGIREWCLDCSERMEVPLEFIAAPAIVALASVIGRQIGIHPKRNDLGWLVVPNLWGAEVARPGLMKTPAIEAAFKPLNVLVAKAIEDHKEVEAAEKAALEVHKAKISTLRRRPT